MDKEILELLRIINSKLDEHKELLQEHSQILGALKHSNEIHKSEIDRANMAIARVEGQIKSIRDDLNAVELITTKNLSDIVELKAVK